MRPLPRVAKTVFMDGPMALVSRELFARWRRRPVPNRHYRKRAEWIRELTLTAGNKPGFWNSYGYHDHGNPWFEKRF